MAVKFSDRDIAIIAGGVGIIDFLSEGRFSAPVARALKKAIIKLGPTAVTTTGRLAGTAAMGIARAAPAIARGARFVTMRHPYIAAAVVTYEAVKHRDQIAQLLGEGWEIVQEIPGKFEEARDARSEFLEQRPGHFLLDKPKRRRTSYNRAISAGMKALKRSNKMGPKGKFTNSKRAFGLVSKTASRINKGAKLVLSNTPVGIATKAMKNILRRRKK